MATQQLSYYIERYQNGTLTEADAVVLQQLIHDGDKEAVIDELMDEELKQWEQSEVSFPEVKMRVNAALMAYITQQRTINHNNRVNKRRLYIAAAVIIGVLCAGTWFYVNNNAGNKNNAAISTNISKKIQAPAANKAMITLADGSRVFLDSAGNGQLAQVGNIQLVKLANGRIVYQTTDGQVLNELQYNTLTNPKGSKVIDMQLSDGTHVWLNAGSSVIYPVAFTGNERKIVLKGEGYFEVAKDPAKKFVVTANGTTTEVLGTHFNINAYGDGTDVKITLLEGSVKIMHLKASALLQPGQQATVTTGNTSPPLPRTISIQTADVEQVMAWKDGLFDFDGLNFGDVMKQLERWYDITVVYEDKLPDIKFGGKLHRSINLNDLLEILEKAEVKFKLEGKKTLIVR